MVIIEAFNEYSTALMTSITTSGSTLSSPPTTAEKHKNSVDSKVDSINMLKSIIDRISKIREYPKNANTISNNNNNKNNNFNNDNNILNAQNNFKSEINNIKIETSTVETFESLLALAKKSISISFKDYLLFQQQRQQQHQQTTTTHYSITQLDLNNRIKHSTLSAHADYLNQFNSSLSLLKSLSYSNLSMDLLNSKSQLFNLSLAQIFKMSNFTSELLPLKGPIDTDTLKLSWSLPSETAIPNKDSSLLIGIAFFYSILIITSLTSNPLLIYVLLWRRKSQIKLIDIFVANLSLSDLFLTLFNIPLSLILYFAGTWPFGSLLCQIGTYSTSCSIYVNIFTMAYISIDRYFAVTRPFITSNQNYHRKKSILMDDRMRRKIYLVLTLIWIIALILSLPQFLFSKVSSTKIASDRDYINYNNKELKSRVEKDLKDLESIKRNEFFFKTLISETTTMRYNDNNQNESEMKESAGDLLLLSDVAKNTDPSDTTFKHCILEYPYVNMRYFMVLVNFLLQYMLPSIVILYFYGRIIYHLYLNLNVEELMEAPLPPSKHIKPITRSRSSSETVKNDIKKSQIDAASLSNTALQEINPPIQRKHSRMRIEGLNRTRNLKKSIKVMIIIIALFLLSWLPLHTYRLVTTFYPLLSEFFEQKSNEKSLSVAYGNLTQNQTQSDYIKSFMKKNSPATEFKTLHNKYVFLFFYFMAMSSVCYNPIVYFWMHKKFRLEVKQIFNRIFNFSRWLKNNRESNRSIITQQSSRKNLEITMTNSEVGPCAPMLPHAPILIRRFSNANNADIDVNGDHCKCNNSQKNLKKKKVSYMASFKIRSKRFSSLSSESNTSKKSDF
jgi:hypothetical protein